MNIIYHLMGVAAPSGMAGGVVMLLIVVAVLAASLATLGGRVHTPADHVLVAGSLSPKSRTAAANGKAVDTFGYSAVLWDFHLGTHDRTTGDETLVGTIEESDDGSTGWVAISGATTGTIGNVVPDTDAGKHYLIQINLNTPRKRYQRAVHTPAGTTPIDLIGASAFLFSGEFKPPTQETTVVTVS